MNLLDKLKAATILAQDEEGLPDFFAERIYTLVELAKSCAGIDDEVADLAEKVSQYDTFGQTGYIGMGVDNLILEESIKRLERKIIQAKKE